VRERSQIWGKKAGGGPSKKETRGRKTMHEERSRQRKKRSKLKRKITPIISKDHIIKTGRQRGYPLIRKNVRNLISVVSPTLIEGEMVGGNHKEKAEKDI